MLCQSCTEQIRDNSTFCNLCGADQTGETSITGDQPQSVDPSAQILALGTFGPGTLLAAGRFQLVRALGAGGMGTVYLAKQVGLDRDVVVKFPHPGLLNQPGFRERFEVEIRHLITLDHPGVVSIFDTGIHEGLPFAVVQFLQGGSLGGRMSEHGLQTPEQIFEWLGPIAEALDSIHEDGVLHRDIKPDNILFDRRGRPYLSDFGISKAMAETQEPSLLDTRTGMFIGSAKYVAPEYIDRRFTPACDQYSLATIVFEALCGRVPHEADTAERMLVQKATTEPKDIRELVESIHDPSALALMKALSKEPTERYGSCSAFAQAFGTMTEPDLLSRTERVWTRHWRRPSRRSVRAAALVIAAATIAVTFSLTRPWSFSFTWGNGHEHAEGGLEPVDGAPNETGAHEDERAQRPKPIEPRLTLPSPEPDDPTVRIPLSRNEPRVESAATKAFSDAAQAYVSFASQKTSTSLRVTVIDTEWHPNASRRRADVDMNSERGARIARRRFGWRARCPRDSTVTSRFFATAMKPLRLGSAALLTFKYAKQTIGLLARLSSDANSLMLQSAAAHAWTCEVRLIRRYQLVQTVDREPMPRRASRQLPLTPK